MHFPRVALFVVSAAVFAACQSGQAVAPPVTTSTPADSRPLVAPVPAPSGDIEFRSVLDLAQVPKPGEPELRGGREAVSADWPASLYATFAARGATAACTAALVGPSVVLTAAHCVPADGGVTITYARATRYTAACTRHPDYAADASADFALCVVTPAFAPPGGFQFETVDTSPMEGLLQRTVILTSFGCVSNIATSAPFDGKYRIGFATIDGVHAPGGPNDLLTRADSARPNLCAGDTGGPVFAGAPVWTDLRDRAIVGVTSRVFRDAAQTGYGASLISATGGPAFRPWAAQWARQAGVAACGIAGSLPTCRN